LSILFSERILLIGKNIFLFYFELPKSITKVSLKVCKSPPIQGKTSLNGLFYK